MGSLLITPENGGPSVEMPKDQNPAPKSKRVRGKNKPKPVEAPARSAEVLFALMEERIGLLDGAVQDHVLGHASRLAELLDELRRSVGRAG